MGTIRRMSGIDRVEIDSGGDVAEFDIDGVAIAGVFIPSGVGLVGAAALEVFNDRGGTAIGGSLHDQSGGALTVTTVAGGVAALPPEALLGQRLKITFGAVSTAATYVYLLTKT